MFTYYNNKDKSIHTSIPVSNGIYSKLNSLFGKITSSFNDIFATKNTSTTTTINGKNNPAYEAPAANKQVTTAVKDAVITSTPTLQSKINIIEPSVKNTDDAVGTKSFQAEVMTPVEQTQHTKAVAVNAQRISDISAAKDLLSEVRAEESCMSTYVTEQTKLMKELAQNQFFIKSGLNARHYADSSDVGTISEAAAYSSAVSSYQYNQRLIDVYKKSVSKIIDYYYKEYGQNDGFNNATEYYDACVIGADNSLTLDNA